MCVHCKYIVVYYQIHLYLEIHVTFSHYSFGFQGTSFWRSLNIKLTSIRDTLIQCLKRHFLLPLMHHLFT